MTDPRNASDIKGISGSLYDVNSSDPRSELVDRSALDPEDVHQITRLMNALSGLREKEKALADASEKYMKLSTQDMRALHFLIVANHRAEVVTPGMLGTHLEMSPASITKLLNRLEKGSHIIRQVHPVDRRAFSIEVTQETRASAMETVGRKHAKRFQAAARLSREERQVVINFLEDMARELALDDVDWTEGN
ncbi:MarR family transcriptional regulator [Corynebacterium hylobatis]|uniref:MarR family transcriptional regulator n=1 Tax=Corynebacterium hylobatis TaxID=1859290 RepID=A0A3S0BZ65_9CORY|nr:MarR family transcriptional regulator [Corynebacterium hylobatis]RSZ61194.1 MarR family transcriptional regulator [Corynebacterium hylobatis]